MFKKTEVRVIFQYYFMKIFNLLDVSSSLCKTLIMSHIIQTYQDTRLERVTHASALFHTLTRPIVSFTRLRPAHLSNFVASFVSGRLMK